MAPMNVVPYQIDHVVKNAGKTVASSKKKIRFRFGFANTVALESGARGVACRGKEHEVTLIWSLTSGKTIVECDAKEIHYSMGGGGKFQFSWPMKKNIVCEIIAHAAPYSSKSDAPPDWKQFDFFINGLSYFKIPKIYELGIVPFRGLEPRPSPYGRDSPKNLGYGGGNYGRNNYNSPPPPPPGNWAAPPQMARQAAPPASPVEANLLDFGSNPAPAPTPVQQQQPQQQPQYGAPTAPEFAHAPPAAAVPPVQQQPAYEQQQQHAPAFAAAPPAPPASHFDNSPAPAFAACPQAPPAPQYNAAPAPTYVEETPAAAPPAPAEVLALPPSQPAVQHHDEKRNPGTMSGVERALGDLVNLNDITATPDLQVGKLTMMSHEDSNKKATAPTFNNDRPLSELKSTTSAEPKKSVMNSFSPAPSMQQPVAQSGYPGQQRMPQQQQMYSQGPPPINNSSGMGMVGFQQQQQPMQQQQQAPYSNYQY